MGLIAAGSAIALVAAGIIAWRVLAPAEVVTSAVTPYPQTAPDPLAGPKGALVRSPLILDDRLRVYAADRRVWADAQPDYRWETNAFWSYRRWPERVSAVVAPKSTDPLVVSLWSDGRLVGLDGRTGTVAWRAETGTKPAVVDGRRTGSSLIWDQQALRTGITSAGKPVIIVVGPTEVRGYSATDGTALWTQPVACSSGDLTAPNAYLTLDGCAHELVRIDLDTGAVGSTPATGRTLDGLGCRVYRSECGGLRLDDGAQSSAAIFAGTQSKPAPALAAPNAWLATTADGQPIAIDSTFTGRDPITGKELWTWRPSGVGDSSPASVIAAVPGRVLLLTRSRTLIALDPADGAELSRASVLLKQDGTAPYDVGPVYAAGRYVAIERHSPGVPSSAGDDEFYYTNRPVLLAVS